MNPKSLHYNPSRWSIGLVLLVPSSCANSASNDDTGTENPDAELHATAGENDRPGGDSDADELVDRVKFALGTDFDAPDTDCDDVDNLDEIGNGTTLRDPD